MTTKSFDPYAKVYLGDSVYAEFNGWAIVLTTENGLPQDPSNVIYLEPSVLRTFIDYASKFFDKDSK